MDDLRRRAAQFGVNGRFDVTFPAVFAEVDMKVVQVNDIYSIVGGSEKTTRRSAEGLRGRGCEVHVLHGEDRLPPTAYVHYVPGLARATLWRYRPVKGRLLALLAEIRPDVVHFRNFDSPPVIAAVNRVYPTVRTVHTVWTYCPMATKFGVNREEACDRPFGLACLARAGRLGCAQRHAGGVVGWGELVRRVAACYAFRAVDRRSDATIVTSQWMKDLLTTCGLAAARVRVIPPPIDIPAAPKDINGGPPTVMSVGRMVPGKGFDDLIRALPYLGKIRLTRVGDGPEREHLRALAAELGVAARVDFLGWVPYDRLADYYNAAHVVALPSLWPEAFGNVGVEALSYGRPVVAYDVGGVRDWLRDQEVGLLARPHDVLDLAAKLSWLLERPGRACAMGRAGRERAKEFSLAFHVERTLAVYREVTGERA